MKNIYFVLISFLAMLTFVACADQYTVTGTTNVHELEGKMLYLKVFSQDEMKSIDSCQVTHGRFHFQGNMDSTMLANLFVDGEGGMPVVLEGCDLQMKIEDIEQTVTGSPLNDTLYQFIHRKNQLDNQLADLPRQEGRMVMDGMNHDDVVNKLNMEAAKIVQRRDNLETSFIKQNFNNVLGPGVFMIITSGYPYPVLTPQIEEILTNATPYFMNHPYVSEFVKVARENTERMQAQ